VSFDLNVSIDALFFINLNVSEGGKKIPLHIIGNIGGSSGEGEKRNLKLYDFLIF
jgi:hypothetical protein